MIALLLVLGVLMLVVTYWPLVVAGLVLYGVWRWGVAPWQEARARQVRERLRHAQARQEIDDIAFATVRAMYEAATPGDIIEGTTVEVERG
ncbi:MAG TPA: hypothetical protein VK790_03640 [Solirubrobacteraceae bacterium]|nr:hypothetical protein [Solirubrobacteraceae bacterium]